MYLRPSFAPKREFSNVRVLYASFSLKITVNATGHTLSRDENYDVISCHQLRNNCQLVRHLDHHFREISNCFRAALLKKAFLLLI